MSTYLELVNSAILESGADLEEIESADFASPDDPMQTKFKRWVKQAWRELQMEINDWQFMSKQAQILIYPQFLIVEGDRATAPGAASEFETTETEATFTLLATPTLLSGTWAAGTAVAIVQYEELDGDVKWGEYVDETSPTPADDIFRLKWWGRYNLATEVSDLLEPDLSTFFIQSTGGSSLQDNSANVDQQPLTFLPWSQFLAGYENDQNSRGRPLYFTKTPEGWYDFWPRPDEGYLLTFTYSAEPQELSAAADTPTGLDSQYQDILVWRTVMYWADYQSRPDAFARAERRYEGYKNRLEKNKKPTFSFSPNQFNY